jgi:pimeloyl-ACP methyl ester carboxylesterase
MISKKILLVFLSFGLLTSAFSQQKFKSIFVKGFTDNNLEVIDWGGNGTPIVFITGLGNSAHVYEDFAPKFTDKHHVYGITRRGFGKSEKTKNGFNTDTLVLDIIKVLDSLSLKKVILIGHSMAGDELSKIVSLFPKRIIATIYLDAAYNHSNLSVLGKTPQPPQPSDSTLPKVEDIIKDQRKYWGFNFPRGEITATNKFDKNGRYVEDTSLIASLAFTEILKYAKPVSYKAIKCPSLAIYAKRETVFERYKEYNLFDTTNKRIATEAIVRWNKYYKTEVENYKQECPSCKVEEIVSGHHYIFLSHPFETEKLIKQFLNTL